MTLSVDPLLGNDIYTVTATSDGAPITALGVNVAGDGNIAVYNPITCPPGTVCIPEPCLLNGFCDPFPPVFIGEYTRVLINDGLIVAGAIATPDLFDINISLAAPFQSQAFLQIVLTGGDAVATIGIVSGGEEITIVPTAQGSKSALIPEPLSLAMLAASSLMLMRRHW